MSHEHRTASIYHAPLREGGSLPAVVEDSAGDLWVVKFRGAGQGPRALVSEILVGELARRLGLPVPDLAVVHLDPEFGAGERDPEIQDILKASRGPNLGMRYMDAAFNLDPVAVPEAVTPELAARVVWLDAFTLNPDRSPRNPNLMFWHGSLWLIDHGAALFDHHDWDRVTEERTHRPFALIGEHVLLDYAGSLTDVDADLAPRLTREVLREVVDLVPDAWLLEPGDPRIHEPSSLAEEVAADRDRYVRYLTTRLSAPRAWVDAAEALRVARQAAPPERLEARR